MNQDANNRFFNQNNEMNYQNTNNNAPKGKKGKKLLTLLLVLLAAVVVVVIINNVTKDNGKSSNNVTEKSGADKESKKIKGNCHAVDCIKKIKVEDTVEDINEIMGFEGELTDKKYNIYSWKISEDEAIKVAYYSGTSGTITAEVTDASIADSKVKFENISELKEKVNEGIFYKDFIKYVGDVDGVVVEKSSYSTKYTWASKDGEYITATFSNSTNKCTLLLGRTK